MANMEDVLDLYAEPYDPQRPVVCFDVHPVVGPAPLCRPGRDFRCGNYEYRKGTRNLFLACEPLTGWRQVAVTQRRTMQDFAQTVAGGRSLPGDPGGRVVMDNLNTHRPASLYRDVPGGRGPADAKRLHYTPKHGSWLNMAEIEFSVLSRSCLKQRLPDQEALAGSPSSG